MDASPHLMAPTQKEELKGDKGLASLQTRWLSSQYLLALRDADCAEQPIGWLGIIPPDFDGSSPSEVMVEVFGRDAMERTQPFLKAAVIAVDVVDVEVGCLRPRPTGGR